MTDPAILRGTKEDHIFTVGETDFVAVRFHSPRDHWRLKIAETGEVMDPGSGGISNESRPKMQSDVEDLLRRSERGDVDMFRRGFGLPPRLERIRELAERVNVDATFDEENKTWSCWHEDGSEHHGFETESAALLSGLRKSDTLEGFRESVKRYVLEDDTLMVVRGGTWLDAQPQLGMKR